MSRIIARLKALDKLRKKRIKEAELDWELNTASNAVIEELITLLPQDEFDRITKYHSDSFSEFMRELRHDEA